MSISHLRSSARSTQPRLEGVRGGVGQSPLDLYKAFHLAAHSRSTSTWQNHSGASRLAYETVASISLQRASSWVRESHIQLHGIQKRTLTLRPKWFMVMLQLRRSEMFTYVCRRHIVFLHFRGLLGQPTLIQMLFHDVGSPITGQFCEVHHWYNGNIPVAQAVLVRALTSFCYATCQVQAPDLSDHHAAHVPVYPALTTAPI